DQFTRGKKLSCIVAWRIATRIGELDLGQLGRSQTGRAGAKSQLLRAAARRVSIPVGNHQRCASSPNLATAVRKAQPAGAAGQINRRVAAAREDKAPELFDGIADLQRVREAESSRIADPACAAIADDPV